MNDQFLKEKTKLEEICKLCGFLDSKYTAKEERKIQVQNFELLWSFHKEIFLKIQNFEE